MCPLASAGHALLAAPARLAIVAELAGQPRGFAGEFWPRLRRSSAPQLTILETLIRLRPRKLGQ